MDVRCARRSNDFTAGRLESLMIEPVARGGQTGYKVWGLKAVAKVDRPHFTFEMPLAARGNASAAERRCGILPGAGGGFEPPPLRVVSRTNKPGSTGATPSWVTTPAEDSVGFSSHGLPCTGRLGQQILVARDLA